MMKQAKANHDSGVSLPESELKRFENLLTTGDRAGLLAFFDGMTEEERTAWYPSVKSISVRVLDASYNVVGYYSDNTIPIACVVAEFATIDYVRFKDRFMSNNDRNRFWYIMPEEAILALKARNHASIRKIVELIVSEKKEDPFFETIWLVRYYIWKHGLYSPVINEKALFQMLCFFGYEGSKTPIRMKEFPEIFERDFWLLFEKEFSEPFYFTYYDQTYKPKGGNFKEVILKFVEEGLVDRERLLSVTLETLKFGYKENDMRWYSDLHRKLKPTPAEIKTREIRYLDLLGDRNPSTVALAFEMLEKLDKANDLDIAAFASSVEPIFRESSKDRSKKTLKIIAKRMKAKTLERSAGLNLVVKGLAHVHADVQTEAAKIITQYIMSDDAVIIKVVTDLLPNLAATVRPLLESIDGGSIGKTRESDLPISQFPSERKNETILAPRKEFGPLDVPRLDHHQKLVPLETFDELIDLAIRIGQVPTSFDEYELFYEGFNRLARPKPEHFDEKVTPLYKTACRQFDLLSIYYNVKSFDFQIDLIVSSITHMILTTIHSPEMIKSLKSDRDNNQVMYFYKLLEEEKEFKWVHEYGCNFALKAHEACLRVVKGITLEPLSTATHHGCWIDPVVLVRRIKSDPKKLTRHDIYDKIASLYRLPIDHRKEAFDELGKYMIGDPYVETVRKILACEDMIDETLPQYFQTAHRLDIALRHNAPLFEYRPEEKVLPFSDLAQRESHKRSKFEREWQRKAIVKNILSESVEKEEYAFYPLSGMEREVELHHPENRWIQAFYRAILSLIPVVREPIYRKVPALMNFWQETGGSYPNMEIFLEPLIDSSEPFTSGATTMVMTAMTAKPEAVGTLAQDVVIQAIEDGRLDGELLAQGARITLKRQCPKTSRWAKRLTTIAAVSPKCAQVIFRMIEGFVPYVPSKEQSGFLELLNELHAEQYFSIKNETCREFLKSITGSGKAAVLAKSLLK